MAVPAVSSLSPFLTMFETFRAELDEHHDRRERIVKASRDITAASKKIIFALQRVQTLNTPLAPSIVKSILPQATTIQTLFRSTWPDLQSINIHRYSRQISPGIQEFMEALLFQHYLETQQLPTYEEAAGRLQALCKTSTPSGISVPIAGLVELEKAGGEAEDGTRGEERDETPLERIVDDGMSTEEPLLTVEDYLLGIYDLTGEMMRFAITSMATSSSLPTSIASNTTSPLTSAPPSSRTTLTDLHTLQHVLTTLPFASKSYGFTKDAASKLRVTQQSVEKVERALYGLVIRGSERPKGWMPDLNSIAREEVEGY